MTKIQAVCPKCGSHLVLKDGQYGEFLACPRFPECRFTRSWADTDGLYKAPSLYCDKCKQTGLLPFIKNDKVIPDTFVDCECKLSLSEHFDPVRPQPSDFDFAMSDTFRAYTYELCSQPDPAPFYLDKKSLQPNEVTTKDSIYNNNYIYRDLAKLGEFRFWQSKLIEHLDKSKRPKKKRLDLSDLT